MHRFYAENALPSVKRNSLILKCSHFRNKTRFLCIASETAATLVVWCAYLCANALEYAPDPLHRPQRPNTNRHNHPPRADPAPPARQLSAPSDKTTHDTTTPTANQERPPTPTRCRHQERPPPPTRREPIPRRHAIRARPRTPYYITRATKTREATPRDCPHHQPRPRATKTRENDPKTTPKSAKFGRNQTKIKKNQTFCAFFSKNVWTFQNFALPLQQKVKTKAI